MEAIQYDERVGCVAVYRGERRNCLAGIHESPDLIFYGQGKWTGSGWKIPWAVRWRAKRAAKRAAQEASS